MYTYIIPSTLLQGLGRHSEADINHLIDEELAALSQMLGDKAFLLGQRPCAADATAFGFLDK
jgi:glutathione S-transferase